jgi:hypothetical protein
VVDEMMCAFGACAVEEGDEYREHIVGLHFVFYERFSRDVSNVLGSALDVNQWWGKELGCDLDLDSDDLDDLDDLDSDDLDEELEVDPDDHFEEDLELAVFSRCFSQVADRPVLARVEEELEDEERFLVEEDDV